MDLQTLWFILITAMLVGYGILDGFDLGVGILYPTLKEDERRTAMNAIGPVWDGNEVWLVAGGGALFAAFPHVYATVFSGFYLAFMLFLAALIFRATALEFRNKETHPLWHKSCDIAFATGSTLAALLLGVALGNLVRGIPVGPDMEFTGRFLGLLNPFSLFCGLVSIALLAFHGATYLAMKSEHHFHQKMVTFSSKGSLVLPPLLTALFIYTWLESTQLQEALTQRPYLLVAALGAVLLPITLKGSLKESASLAMLFSSAGVALTLVFFFAGLYPNFVYCPEHPSYSLTIQNASSSPETLKTMAVIAAATLPFILFYTIWVYRVFKGPAKDHHGY
jgi:cytochrome d ubiquinol oxidase subunit II